MSVESRSIPVVRVKIVSEQPARREEDDRELIGYRDDLSLEELWDRGRKAWKLKANRVMASELLVIAHGGIVRGVGTIEGISRQGDRLVIEGTPIANHPLIGKPDQLDNKSQYPVTYGRVTV